MNQLLHHLAANPITTGWSAPAVDLEETDDEFVIDIDLPGAPPHPHHRPRRPERTTVMTAAPVPDPYLVLGVTAEASDNDLDHAFRRLIRQLHPDTRPPAVPDPDDDQRLQNLLTAYATLRDPIQRATYDRTHREQTTKPHLAVPRPRVAAPPPLPPDLRAGPVHWAPLPHPTPGGPAVAARPGRPKGIHHGAH